MTYIKRMTHRRENDAGFLARHRNLGDMMFDVNSVIRAEPDWTDDRIARKCNVLAYFVRIQRKALRLKDNVHVLYN